mmetsp:Transcript_47523/g.128212  ORF Transcript_47523/g.128212 Transcript_47523/m.128212 type:complete len:325 (+) Transcript_47523:891-1865(+)
MLMACCTAAKPASASLRVFAFSADSAARSSVASSSPFLFSAICVLSVAMSIESCDASADLMVLSLLTVSDSPTASSRSPTALLIPSSQNSLWLASAKASASRRAMRSVMSWRTLTKGSSCRPPCVACWDASTRRLTMASIELCKRSDAELSRATAFSRPPALWPPRSPRSCRKLGALFRVCRSFSFWFALQFGAAPDSSDSMAEARACSSSARVLERWSQKAAFSWHSDVSTPMNASSAVLALASTYPASTAVAFCACFSASTLSFSALSISLNFFSLLFSRRMLSYSFLFSNSVVSRSFFSLVNWFLRSSRTSMTSLEWYVDS